MLTIEIIIDRVSTWFWVCTHICVPCMLTGILRVFSKSRNSSITMNLLVILGHNKHNIIHYLMYLFDWKWSEKNVFKRLSSTWNFTGIPCIILLNTVGWNICSQIALWFPNTYMTGCIKHNPEWYTIDILCSYNCFLVVEMLRNVLWVLISPFLQDKAFDWSNIKSSFLHSLRRNYSSLILTILEFDQRRA